MDTKGQTGVASKLQGIKSSPGRQSLQHNQAGAGDGGL